MTLRRSFVSMCAVVALSAPLFAAGRARSDNFDVSAPTQQLADQFAEYAERYRVEKAMDWLGEEMPTWPKRCPLKVEVTPGRTGGATTFNFGNRGGISSQDMHIFGDTKSLLESVLPHEVTHTVLAYHFGVPVPRWADEGGSVLSENDKERLEHDIKCREFLNAGRGIPLKHLFPMTDYPRDTIVLYAQGFSVSNYLIDQGGGGLAGRKKFLAFLEAGMKKDGRNWDAAVKANYPGTEDVDDLQEKWIASLKNPPVAKRTKQGEVAQVAAVSRGEGRGEVRTSAGLGLPQLEQPVVGVSRGAAPQYDDRAAPRPSSYGSTPTAKPLGGPRPELEPPVRGEWPPLPKMLPPEVPSR